MLFGQQLKQVMPPMYPFKCYQEDQLSSEGEERQEHKTHLISILGFVAKSVRPSILNSFCPQSNFVRIIKLMSR